MTQHVAVLGLLNSTERQRCMQGYAYLRNLSDQRETRVVSDEGATSPKELRMSRASRCKRLSVTRYSSRRTTNNEAIVFLADFKLGWTELVEL
jgi:hypothetical protein